MTNYFKFGLYSRAKTINVVEVLLSCSLNQQSETAVAISTATEQLLKLLHETDNCELKENSIAVFEETATRLKGSTTVSG